jgi:hypothetical protein
MAVRDVFFSVERLTTPLVTQFLVFFPVGNLTIFAAVVGYLTALAYH